MEAQNQDPAASPGSVTLTTLEAQVRAQAPDAARNNARRRATTIADRVAARVVNKLLGFSYEEIPEAKSVLGSLGFVNRNALLLHLRNVALPLAEAQRPKKQGSKNPTGTCQVCFKAQKVVSTQRVEGSIISLHGYKRPGHGYIEGRCWGAQYAPFEVSCERTKAWLTYLHGFEAEKAAYLGKLQANEVEVMHYERVNYNLARNDPNRVKLIPVERGAPAVGPSYRPDVPSFETLRTIAIGRVQGLLIHVRSDIKFFEGKVAAWKPTKLKTARGVAS